MQTNITEQLNERLAGAPADLTLIAFIDNALAPFPGWYRSSRGGIIGPDGDRWRLCMRDGLFKLTQWRGAA